MTHQPPSQPLPSFATPLVEARRWPWSLTAGLTHGEVCRLLVAPLAADAPDLDTLLTPFDRVRAARDLKRARAVSRHWLRRWIAGWPAVACPAMGVAAAVDCAIRLLPYQLSPAVAVVEGDGTRVLLADEVGAGKTIEAGLIIAELAARQAADRVLILTPSALRDQWRDELAARCSIGVTVVDRIAVRTRHREAPPGLGPFDAPARLVMSIDLAKQPDVLTHLMAPAWDVLVLDEAHLASGDSARMAAAQALGRRARVIVLASATPHAGDEDAFARLGRIGDLDDGPMLVFRRPAPRDPDVAAPAIRDIRARRSPAEREAHSHLLRYARRLDAGGARLAAAVLRKRALSSPAALWHSLHHRAEWLSRQPGPLSQPLLPFDDEEQQRGDAEQPAALRQPALQDARAEARLLQDALDAARRAAAGWGKARAVVRLLATTREPVLIFTEYRDTLDAIVAEVSAQATYAVLHGGLDRAARNSALSRFSSGDARVLIATDVAAEGLNLQHACRLVVHVELPWSPARLEQRNGRVDRLGQRRRVHVWRLLGDPAHEARLVAALSARVARARRAGFDVAPGSAFGPPPREAALEGTSLRRSSGNSRHAASECTLIRALVHACRRPGLAGGTSGNRGRLAWRRLRRNPAGLPRGVIVVWLRPALTHGVRAALVAVHVQLTAWPPGTPSAWLPVVARCVAAAVPRETALPHALARREQRLLIATEADHAQTTSRWQPSLFEQRAARVVAATRDAAAGRAASHRRRLAELELHAGLAGTPVLALLVR
jgi:superfamily II DNA or RNA helicase